MCRAVLLALVCLLPLSALRGQEKLTVTVPYRGVNVFANLLHEEGFTALKTLEDLQDADPKDTLVIVFGKLNRVPALEEVLGTSAERFPVLKEGKLFELAPLEGLTNFQWRGGSILIATDYSSRPHLDPLQVTISGAPIRQDEEFAYQRRFTHCPILATKAGEHPLLRSLTRPLVTMRPSAIAVMPALDEILFTRYQTLFSFGPGSRLLGMVPRDAQGFPFLVASPAGAPPAGRIVVAAGHGVFMNFAMVSAEHGNFLFARNLIRWLAEKPGGKRTKVFLMEQGTIAQRLDLPLKSPPIPWGALMNTAVDQIQQRRLLEEFVDRNWWPHQIWSVALIAGAALLLPFAFRRVIGARFRRDARAALVVGLHDAPPPPLPINRQREAEATRRDNFADAARVLILQWLDETAGDHHPVPAYQIDASFWRRRRLQKELDWVLRLARPGGAPSVSARELRRIAATLQALAQAQRQGEFRFVSPGPALKKD